MLQTESKIVSNDPFFVYFSFGEFYEKKQSNFYLIRFLTER